MRAPVNWSAWDEVQWIRRDLLLFLLPPSTVVVVQNWTFLLVYFTKIIATNATMLHSIYTNCNLVKRSLGCCCVAMRHHISSIFKTMKMKWEELRHDLFYFTLQHNIYFIIAYYDIMSNEMAFGSFILFGLYLKRWILLASFYCSGCGRILMMLGCVCSLLVPTVKKLTNKVFWISNFGLMLYSALTTFVHWLRSFVCRWPMGYC